MPILYTLSVYPTVRFNELQRHIHDISYKTLSRNLKELEAAGLINRKEYAQIPPKVEYSLTKDGQSMIVILDEFSAWGENHMIKQKNKTS
jgi:DNA-binding HxlR family transcriptional regulator